MTRIAVIYYSALHGHTKTLADCVRDGAASVDGTKVTVMEATKVDWEVLEQSDALIFGSPTYMGSVAAPFKQFMDDSSAAWMARKWRDKLAAGFTSSHGYSGDKLNVLIQLAVFAAQHGMIWVGVGDAQAGSGRDHVNRLGSFLGMMAQSDSKDQGLVPPEGDRKTAFNLGARVAQLGTRLKK